MLIQRLIKRAIAPWDTKRMAAHTRSRSRRHQPLTVRQAMARPIYAEADRTESPRLRLISVWLLLVAGMMAIGIRLAYLQLVIGDDLQTMAKEQQAIQATPQISRRQIVDRQGNVIAMDQVVYSLFVHPMLFKKTNKEVAQMLSTVLEQEPKDLSKLFAQQESGIKVSIDISEETAKRIRALRLDGLELVASPKRFYPQGDLFSQVTGYVDLEGLPGGGIELDMQDQLKYDAPKAGEAVPLQQVARDASQLQLTIDSRLQRIAQKDLAITVDKFSAKRGVVIVMDSRTGEILTLAVAPTYDPNQYFDANIEYFKNWAVSDLYEPGSTFKPINVAIALENGSIGPNDTIYDGGQIFVGGWPIQNVDFSTNGGRGPLSITDVLRYSSNVAMVHMMETLQRSTYYDWLEKLGLGQPTGIDLPGEAVGQIKDRQQFIDSPIEAATTAFGQGFSLTPMQLAQLHATLANGGKLVTPHVVRGFVNADKELTWTPDRQAPRQVFSPETAGEVLAMMKAVVDDGTGSASKIDGYQIAGKTGTAQKATEYGSYGNQRITSFVGIAPVSDPHYVVLVVVDEPQGENSYGGTVAAPLVKKILESLVVLEGVAPDGGASPTSPAAQPQ